ncbi:unnamed protein product, partial [Staurois parvus]
MITSLRARVHETEEETGLLATSKSRAELTIQAVLHENRELKDRIQEMESRLKTFVAQWEDSKSQASRYSRNYGHFLAQLSACLNVDIKGQKDPEELVISKTGDLLKENIELKGNVVTLKETINVHETESKASRETIMKLVSEINKEKKKSGSFVQQIDTLCKNLESVSDAKQAFEKETMMLQDRLKASQRAWEACKQELNQVKKSSTKLDMSLKSSVGEAKAAQNLLDLFMDEVAAALSDASITVKPKDETILERIHDLQKMVESKKIVSNRKFQRGPVTRPYISTKN